MAINKLGKKFKSKKEEFVENQPTTPNPAVMGNFNPEKKQFETTTGQNYPTTNPDFVPKDPKETEQIVFKNDGSVDVSPVGTDKPINLSKEEYNVTLGKPGNVTNKVKQVQEAQEPQALGQDLKPIPTMSDLMQTPEGQKTDITGSGAGDALNFVASSLDTIMASIPISGLKFKEPKAVSDAKQGFNAMSGVIENDIKLFQAGQISSAQVQRDIDKALEFTTALYAQTKGKGQANLEFWRDEGASIEAEVLKQLRDLENQKRMLGL